MEVIYGEPKAGAKEGGGGVENGKRGNREFS